MTVKGRYHHTLRWIWHSNKINLPYKVVVADGEESSPITEFLSDKSNFPNLDLTYLRFNDHNLSDFFLKCSTVISLVETPYVMFVDNDDFVFPSGLNECVSYLENNPDYVSAQGNISGFHLKPTGNKLSEITGSLENIYQKYSKGYVSRSIDCADPMIRMKSILTPYHVIFYSVYRAKALKVITEEVVDLKLSDLQVWEVFCALKTASLGKIYSSENFHFYLRQKGTSQTKNKKGDLVTNILKPEYSLSLKSMLNSLSDGSTESETELRLTYENYIRNVFVAIYQKSPLILRYLRKTGEIIWKWFSRPARTALFFRKINHKLSREQRAEFQFIIKTLDDDHLSKTITKWTTNI